MSINLMYVQDGEDRNHQYLSNLQNVLFIDQLNTDQPKMSSFSSKNTVQTEKWYCIGKIKICTSAWGNKDFLSSVVRLFLWQLFTQQPSLVN